MKRWGLIVALLLSVGLNVGVLATLAVTGRASPSTSPGPEPTSTAGPRFGMPGDPAPAAVEAQRQFMRELAGERFAVEALRRELRMELVAESPDRERVARLLGELAQRSSALEQRFAEFVLATRSQLGPEDEQRYLEMLRRIPELRERGPYPDRRWRGGPPPWEHERRLRERRAPEPKR